ncbi:MAG: chemotaxis response regulator protein-glutamate methylesterase [Alphaproteobacteria bacterium]
MNLARQITVLIVDDSALTRSLIEKSLSENPNIRIVGYAANGKIAIDNVLVYKPDLVLLDIEMPVMDGITALPLIKQAKPDVAVLVCSTLSSHGAEITMKALELGASDYICKPGASAGALRTSSEFKQELVEKVMAVGTKALDAQRERAPAKAQSQSTSTAYSSRKIKPVSVIAIGSSTGGPNALIPLLKEFTQFPVPIVITQHMPKMFTAVLASHIEEATNIKSVEALDGMILEPGRVYVAPGDYHMEFRQLIDRVEIKLNQGPMENFCRPSVDPMMRSLTRIFKEGVFAIILTGMGKDGLEGCRMVSNAGGTVIAQDEESSVVWGMPGAVHDDGLTRVLLPPQDMGLWLKNNASTIEYGYK